MIALLGSIIVIWPASARVFLAHGSGIQRLTATASSCLIADNPYPPITQSFCKPTEVLLWSNIKLSTHPWGRFRNYS